MAVLAVLAAVVSLGSGAGAAVRARVSPNVPVTAENLIDRTASNSPLLVADPTQPRFVALANRLDGPDFSCGLQVSGDGGRSWLSANPVPKLPEGAERCYAPEAAFDRHGRLYFLFLGLQGAGNSPMGAFLTTSSDRGNTFSPPIQVLGPERYQVRMAIDPAMGPNGRIHLVWLQTTSSPPTGGLPAPPNPLMAAWSDDGGRTFSPAVQISDSERQLVVAPVLTVGPHHAVQVVYYDLRDDRRDYQGLEGPAWEERWSLVATRSTDGGEHFGHGVAVDDDLVPPERVMLIYTMPPPALVSDGAGRLYVAWYDDRNGDWDVFLRRSLDGGRTWDPPRRLNDDTLHDGSHQYLPRLSVSPDGRIDAIFYDRRGNQENRGNDVYYTSSADHGVTFTPNLKVTTLDSDSHIGPRYDVPSAAGLNEFGSRIALSSQRSNALAAWTDTRNTGRGFPAQDIFAASIELAQPHTGPPWPLLLGAPVALSGGALVLLLLRRRRRVSEEPDGEAQQQGAGRMAGEPGRHGRSTMLIAAAILLAGCASGAGGPLPPRPPVVDVQMREFAFDHGRIPSGRVVFGVHNTGTIAHRLSLVPLPDDLPPIVEQLRGDQRQSVFTLAAVPDVPPGGTGTFAVDLKSGRYALICFIVDPDGVSHGVKGMATDVRIS